MLETIRIQNFAIIDELEVNFKKGLNVITGETGAGKSILVDAIGLVLGGRASSHVIRKEQDFALVEALFDISKIPEAQNRLLNFGIKFEDQSLLVRRMIYSTGKNKIWINGQLGNVHMLKEIGKGLVDLCGQHEHQTLTHPSYQTQLIDRFGKLEKQVATYSENFQSWSELSKKIEDLKSQKSDQGRELDFIRFQIQEIEEINPQPEEESQLEKEKSQLSSADEILSLCEDVESAFYSSDSSVISKIGSVLQQMEEKKQTIDGSDQPLQWLRESKSLLEEAVYFFRELENKVDNDPSKLDETLQRLEDLTKLKRKYGAEISEILKTKKTLEEKKSFLEDAEFHVGELENELSKLEELLQIQADRVHKARVKIGKKLSSSVTAELQDLEMLGALFEIRVEKTETFQARGMDQIQYWVQPNPGESSEALTKIASGGELSRITLGIRRVISDKGGIGVYLFDEIDAGVGGRTGLKVGEKLKEVSKFNQVICITHLPQVAAFADHHLSIQKKTVQKRTVSRVEILNQKNRELELVRMMGSSEVSNTSRAHAKELLAYSNKHKSQSKPRIH